MVSSHCENSVIAVVVVYERDLEHTKPWAQLRTMLTSAERSGLRLQHILIYDNSARPRITPPAIQGCSYVHDPDNGGTAAAYALASRLAQDFRFGWLLLMDHDTLLPENFFERASEALAAQAERPGALLPWVVHDNRPVSPARMTWAGSIRPLDRKRNVPAGDLTGIASGSLIDTTTMQAVGEFPPTLWLDYVDHWIFARVNALGRKVIVFNALVDHDLSIFGPTSLSRARLHTILEGERVFVRSLPWYARAFQPFRFAQRLLRYAIRQPRTAVNMLVWIFSRSKMNR